MTDAERKEIAQEFLAEYMKGYKQFESQRQRRRLPTT
jgi:hypothetical protein